MKYIWMFLIAFIVFLVIDGIWLTLVANNFYKTKLGYIMSEKPKYVAAILFYIIFLIGLVYFVIAPGIDKQSIKTILIGGALFGLVGYATYDLTNLATLKDWPIIITVVDLIWGTVLSLSVSVASYYIYQIIF